MKLILQQAINGQRRSIGKHYSCFYLGAMWVWYVNATVRPLYPQKEARYAFYRRLCGRKSRSGLVRKNLAPHQDSIPGPSRQQPVAKPTTILSDWSEKNNIQQ